MTYRVLIVDDDVGVRNILRGVLEKCGYEVSVAVDGCDAIRQLSDSNYNLVITDLLMPVQDGLEVVMFLRKNQPSVKVIAISALGNNPLLQCALGLGADCTFEKPLVLAGIAKTANVLLLRE